MYTYNVEGFTSYTFAKDKALSDVTVFPAYYGGIEPDTQNEWRNLYKGAATLNKSFRLACSQYDQVRLKSMKIRLTPATLPGDTKPMIIMSVTDRNANNAEVAGTAEFTHDYRMSPKEIEDNPGVIISTITGKINRPIERYCIANNLKEMNTYIDTNLNYYQYTTRPTKDVLIRINDWINKKADFAPCFYTCMRRIETSTALNIIMAYNVEYTFEFRNPKNKVEQFLTTELKYFPSTVSRSVIKYYEDSQKDQKTPSHDAVLPSESGFDP